MAIKVIVPGPLATVQDGGRWGYQQFGMPCSGVMDQAAYEKANRLVGNRKGEAVLELTLFGGIYLFDRDALIALSGADMNPTVDGAPVPMNRPVSVKAGSSLSLGAALSGCRAYLAAAGGIQVPLVMGSRSTNLKCGIGGFQGRSLQAGDVLEIPPLNGTGAMEDGARSGEEAMRGARETQSAPSGNWQDHPEEYPLHPVYPSSVTLRVIPGPQEDYFTPAGLNTFYSCPYTLTEESDRMGCRLSGPVIESMSGTDIISDGIVFGSIQVTSAGMPIVLMADRQTTGGYAKIATVYSEDLPLLAQCRPGAAVRFQKLEPEWLADIACEPEDAAPEKSNQKLYQK